MLTVGYLAVFGGALLLGLLLTPLVRRLAVAWGAVDLPGDRKIHTQPVPRLGGVAVLVAVVLAVAGALWLNPVLQPAIAGTLGAVRWSVLAGAALVIVIMGSIDDLTGLPARTKFLIEIAAAAAVVFVAGAPWAVDFSPFAFSVHLGVLEPVIGILWIVALTNAVNMTDVVDGVAAGTSAIAAAALALMSFTVGNLVATTVLLALSGALIGFLPHNFRSPKIFLGDTGSLGAGFILGSASLVGLQRGATWLVVPVLLALALPLTEIALTMARRALHALVVERKSLPSERFMLHAGRPGLFVADRRHIPHRLLELGLRQPTALGVLYAIGAALGALGLATVRWPSLGPFVGLGALVLVIYFAPRWLYRELRVLERGAFLPLLENRIVRSRLLHAAYDAAVVFVAGVAAQVLVAGTSILGTGGAVWARAGVATVAALVGFRLAGLYRAAYRHAGLSEMLRASRSVVLGLVLAALALTVFSSRPPPPAVWLLHLFLALTGVIGARVSFRILDHMYQLGRHSGRRVLIFGAGRGGDLVLREIRANPALDVNAVGFVDDDPRKWGRRFHGLDVHAGHELEALLHSQGVDDVILSTQKLPPARYRALTALCEKVGAGLLSLDVRWGMVPGVGIEPVAVEPDLALAMPADVGSAELGAVSTEAHIRLDELNKGNGHGEGKE